MAVLSGGPLVVPASADAARGSWRGFQPPTVHLAQQPERLGELPVLTSPEAIPLLNKQRAANGIPGDLTENTSLSEGCVSWATIYRPAQGQYPHEELHGQPGYTPLGDEAAKSSDLSGEPGTGFTVGEEWGPFFNPWSGAAIHLAQLFDPATTTVWYGASKAAACMGTQGARAFSTPTFFSFPGNGATEVPTAENTGEWPYSPQQAAGLKAGYYGAPAIIIWAEDTNSTVQSAILRAATGNMVPTRLVTPATPEPNGNGTVGRFTHASFLVPVSKFRARTQYTATVHWRGADGVDAVQTIGFTTAATDLAGQVEREERERGARPVTVGNFAPKLAGHHLRITATGLAVGRFVTVRLERCPLSRCDYKNLKHPWKRRVQLGVSPVTLTVPHATPGWRSILTVYMPDFLLRDQTITAGVTGVPLTASG